MAEKCGWQICLTFRPAGTILTVTGRADLTHDRAKIGELWSAEAQAWWPKGPDDPDVRLLRVIPESAEYWDARGNSMNYRIQTDDGTGSPVRPIDASHKVRLPIGEPESEAPMNRTDSVSAAAICLGHMDVSNTNVRRGFHPIILLAKRRHASTGG